MYIDFWILASSTWFCLSVLCLIKQLKVDKEFTFQVFLAGMVSPLFFIGAVIRQVIVEDWK